MQNKLIVFANFSTSWGGGERWHFEHGKYFVQKGWQVHFITKENSELSQRLKTEHISQSAFPVSNLSWLNPFLKRRIKSLLNKISPSHIILNGSKELKLLAPLAHKSKIASIIYRRGLDRPIKNNALNRKLLRKYCTHVLCNSQATLNTICPPASPKTCHVIYNGIPFKSHKSKTISSNQKLIIGNAGRLVAQKNQLELIQLAINLKQQNFDFEIRIAGEGPLKNVLKTEIENNNLEGRVKLLGFVDNMDTFYKNINVFILTSHFEGFGFVLAEAMMHGVPAIAKKVSSNPELIIQAETGYLYKNMNEINNYLNQLKDPVNYELMSLSARELVKSKFNFTTNAESLERWLIHSGR